MPAKPVSELTKDFTPERLARIKEKAEDLQAGVVINRLRQARGLTQAQLAERMGVTQQAISVMEWGDDIKLSTLQKVFAALDSELFIHTPDGDLPLSAASEADTAAQPTG